MIAVWISIAATVFCGLVALVYNNMDNRIKECETDSKLIRDISVDVKFIKANCLKCQDAE